MLFNFDSRGSGRITEDSFRFTGRYLFASGNDGIWELALLESGTLTWLTNPGRVDLCLVGAGNDGGNGYSNGTWQGAYVYSGSGGDGGRVYSNTAGVTLGTEIDVVVGAEKGADSSIGSWSSANGQAIKGGRGAEMPQQSNAVGTVNTGGADGVWPFGEAADNTMIPELQGKRMAPSGGGGHANNRIEYAGNPPYYNYVYTDEHGGDNEGGASGAGNGGERSHRNGYDATGIGAGGGGGYGRGESYDGGYGGKGSQGAVLIRKHKEVTAA